MHPDLSPHLHNSECNELINALKKCHTDVHILNSVPSGVFYIPIYFNNPTFFSPQNTFARFVGACNTADALLNRCLREERKQNQSTNRQKAIDKQNQFKERLRLSNSTE